MMGYNHATLATGLGILALPAVQLPSITSQVAWVLCCTGMGLFPDWDKDGSHVSRMWGWPSRMIARGINVLSGGHRWGTHDVVLCPIACAALLTLAARHPLSQIAAIAVCIGLAVRACIAKRLWRVGEVMTAAVSWGGAWLLVRDGHGAVVDWLPAAAAVGIVAHALGDVLTEEGVPVPVVWLWRKQRVHLELFVTNSPVERRVVAPVLSVLVVLAAYQVSGIRSWGGLWDALAHLGRSLPVA